MREDEQESTQKKTHVLCAWFIFDTCDLPAEGNDRLYAPTSAVENAAFSVAFNGGFTIINNRGGHYVVAEKVDLWFRN